MQRSQSTLGSFSDYKTKKFWKFSKSSSTTSSSPVGVSSPNNTLNSSPTSKSRLASSQSSKKLHPSSRSSSTSSTVTATTTTSSKLKNRASLIISEPTKISTRQLRDNLNATKHKSHMEFGTFKIDEDEVTDPKELEFYKQILGNNKQSPDHSDTSTISEESLELQKVVPSVIDTTPALDDTLKSPDSLSSALEDYKLFTKRARDSVMLSHDLGYEGYEKTRTTSLPSLPSFSSTQTMDSEVSVHHISNSIWVGTTIVEDLDTHNEKDHVQVNDRDTFEDFDSYNVFNEDDVAVKSHSKVSHRTSLIFL